MAASVYEQVLKQEPDFPETHTKLGYLMYRLGNPEEGLREARVAQASSSALMQRQWDEAVRSYKQAVKLAEKLLPHDGRLAIALGELGRITMGLQQFAEADSFFHREQQFRDELGFRHPEDLLGGEHPRLLEESHERLRELIDAALEIAEPLRVPQLLGL